VVEGIEQEAEAEVLISLGCDLGQGYLFGKPMPADEISALVGGKVRFGAARKARPKPRPRALTRSGAGTAAADDGS
jgi:predicted signal transduction protein with EAL and GGDEF domain